MFHIHILKVYDESYSKNIREHKYKDKDNGKDNDQDKDADKVPEITSICYIFEITHYKYEKKEMSPWRDDEWKIELLSQ